MHNQWKYLLYHKENDSIHSHIFIWKPNKSPVRWIWIGFIQCFTTTFLHILAKLGRWGWLMRMRLVWKKSQKTLDTSKRLHRNKTRRTGSVGKGLDPNFAIIGNCRLGESAGASCLKAPSGLVKNPGRWRLQPGRLEPGLDFGSRQTQGGGVQSCLT